MEDIITYSSQMAMEARNNQWKTIDRRCRSCEGETHRHGSVELENSEPPRRTCQRRHSQAKVVVHDEINLPLYFQTPAMAFCSTVEEAKLPGGYLVTPRVPQGLAAAVEGLTREVIRHSPKDIYVFAAHHFEKLLHVRERCEVSSVEKSCPVSRRDEGTRALQDMSRALRARELDRAITRTTGNQLDQVGWSLCQTAKVLKRHRSIFGDEGRRVTTDEVFRMASENESDRRESRGKRSTREKVASSRRDELWKTGTTSATERTCSNAESMGETGDSSGERGRSGPRIMTPIASLSSGNVMLAKDIKTELRKNRLSSRERRTARASRHEDKTHRAEKAESRVPKSSVKTGGSSSKKSCPDKQKKVETNVEESKGRYRQNDELTSSRKQRGKSREAANEEISKAQTPAMDRVKDYVVGRFATTKSLEELQTLNYVEKVQEIIDETSPIIKEKIEQLKTGFVGGPEAVSPKKRQSLAGRGDLQEASQCLSSTSDALESRLTETRDLMASVSSSFSRTTRRSRSARSFRRSENTRDEVPEEWREGTFDKRENQLEERLSRTRDLLENVSSSLSRPVRRSSSAKTSLRKGHETTDDENCKDALVKRLDETRNLLRGVSASFGKSGEKITRHGATTYDAEESSNSEDPTKTSLPAVRSNPTRNSSGGASRSDPDNLVLPAISPEAPRSAKVREDLILPVLSPSAGASSTDEFADSSKTLDANDDAILENYGVSEAPDENNTAEVPMENVSRDSLNVTPDFDSIPQRPDSLEPVETSEANISEVARLEAKASDCPPTADPDDLEARTPDLDVLEPEFSGVDAESSAPDDLETRLREIRQVESAVAEAFGTKVKSEPRESTSSLIEDELREFEEEERLVDAIFDAENHDKDERVDRVLRGTVSGALDSGKKMENEAIELRPDEANEAPENDQSPLEDRESDNLRHTSPEPLSCTYVLTEGSPYDIPDTVTTVVIPDRSVESPLSDRLRVELDDDEEIRVSLIPGNKEREELIEEVADEWVQSEVEAKIDSGDSKSSRDDLRRGSTTNRNEEEDTSPKSSSDPFGEFIEPETIAEATSADVDFIREIEEMQIPRQDLGSINEEGSEELEDLGESPEVEKAEESSSPMIGDVAKDAREESEVRNVSVEETKVVESDLSPEGTRPDDVYSESSNEAKESSVLDEAPVSAKCDNSMADEEEISSGTRTAESSNEVKETTLTDGLSMSIDPTRPFVPELNLDSLQDITVSSFKITEDDCDNRERGESENTNSITDTLTSDENNRVNDSGLLVRPSATEATTHEAAEGAQEVEEIIVKSQVEAKEDICEKTSSYVTGPSREGDDTEGDAEMGGGEAEEKLADSASPEAAVTKEEEDKAATLSIEDSSDQREVGILRARKEEQDEAVEEKEDIEIPKEYDDDNRGDIAERKDEAKVASKEENPEDANAETTNRNGNVDQADKSASPGEEEDITATVLSEEYENVVIVEFDEQEDIPGRSGGEEITRTEVTNEKENVGPEKDEEITRTEVTNEKENVGPEKDEEITSGSEKAKMGTVEDSREMVSADIEAIGKDEKTLTKSKEEDILETMVRRTSDEDIDAKDADIEKTEECEALEEMADERPRSLEDENGGLEMARSDEKDGASSEGDVVNVQSIENEDGGKTEVRVDDLPEFDPSDERVSKNFGPGAKRDSLTSEKAKDEFDEEISSRELEDDVLEDSYVEDETPLAFSRSASQCTTRRVSSGNLAKLREDPTLGWHDETEREDCDDGMGENDTDSARVKFFGVDENATLEKSGSDDTGGNSSDNTRDTGNAINETRTIEDGSEEYHIYVPEVDTNADNSTTETSSTIDSAVTKIQAGVRGFLARRRLQRGQQNRSSTLSSIPSIQDSEAIEPQRTDDRDREASEEKGPGAEEARVSSPKTSMNNDIASDPTKIQSNYRGYEARKRLRREDAVQRTTFSLDKSFAANGLQHTGEFHDCIALPIHDIAISREPSKVRKNAVHDIEVTGKNFDDEHGDVGELGLEEKVGSTDVQDEGPTSSDREETAPKTSILLDPSRLFFPTSGTPLVQFDTRPSVGQLVDLVVLAKDDAALQTGYLNFITSVEDNEALISPTEVPLDTKKCHAEEPNSNESLMEPLALSDPPIGVIIEEVTSSDAENLTRPDEDHDRTMASANSSLAPEVIEDSPEPVSPSVEHHRESGNTSNGSRIKAEENGSYRATGGEDKRSEEPDTSLENVTFDSEVRDSANPEKAEDNTGPDMDSMMNYIMLPGPASATQDQHLLGPESSVDSMECPQVQAKEKNISATSDLPVDASAVDASASTQNLTEEVTQRISPSEGDSSDTSEIMMENKKETIAPNADDASPKSPLPVKVEDSLDLGSEDTAGAHDKKPVPEVTLKSGDMTKSMSLSQDSQLADERIASPVTMIQIGPKLSESLKQDNHSDSADDKGTSNVDPTTPKSDEK